MKVLKIIVLCFLIVGCYSKNDNLYFEEKYSISNSSYSMLEIDSDELNDLVKNNFDGTVLVLREDCEYCHELMKLINEKMNLLNCNKNAKIYIIESDKLSEAKKIKFADEFSLTSVPSILFFEKGKLKLTEVSIPSEQRINELVKIMAK